MTAERKWLIRSKKRGFTQIVGPVSSKKVRELKEANVIGPEVEICSENGFWFWLKEEDLYNRYIMHAEAQPFNPISEAKSVLTTPVGESADEREVNHDITIVGGINLADLQADKVSSDSSDTDEVALPPEDDLAFPDIGQVNETPAINAGISTAEKVDEAEVRDKTSEHINAKIALPSAEDLEFPEVGSVSNMKVENDKTVTAENTEHSPSKSSTEVDTGKTKGKKKKIAKGKKKKNKIDRRDRHKPKRNDRLLLLFVAGLVAALLIIAYIFLGSNKLFSWNNPLLPQAQASMELEKKN